MGLVMEVGEEFEKKGFKCVVALSYLFTNSRTTRSPVSFKLTKFQLVRLEVEDLQQDDQ